MNKIKVLIVDDHAMVCQALSILLNSFDEIEVVAIAHDGQMAVTMCHFYQPDVVLMDLTMPVTDGVKATRLILEANPRIKIVVLSSTGEQELIQEALRAGATGFLSKVGSAEEIAEAVRKAYHGQPYLDMQGLSALISIQQSPAQQIGHDLTQRQREVLSLLVEGLNNSQIAERMCITKTTVKNHIHGIFTKLNVANRVRAVALVLKNNILQNQNS
jgi:NarL family two-component system response regulator LiaR